MAKLTIDVKTKFTVWFYLFKVAIVLNMPKISYYIIQNKTIAKIKIGNGKYESVKYSK